MRHQLGQLIIVCLCMLSPVSTADELDDFELLADIADADYRNISDPGTLEHPPFIHDKTLLIEAGKLDDPWIKNRQCHANFPLFPDLQIAFREGAVRSLRITHQENVENAWIEGPTVQMKQTRPETRLCFESENRVFSFDEVSNTYTLRVGPYFLRLFDGYFPLQVKLKIRYPDELLALISMSPDSVEGAEVRFGEGEIYLENVFEGRLELEFRFARHPASDGPGHSPAL